LSLTLWSVAAIRLAEEVIDTLGWFFVDDLTRDNDGPLVMTGAAGAWWPDPDLAEESWVVLCCGLDLRSSENGLVALPWDSLDESMSLFLALGSSPSLVPSGPLVLESQHVGVEEVAEM